MIHKKENGSLNGAFGKQHSQPCALMATLAKQLLFNLKSESIASNPDIQ
jgi:hypothetical protein